MEEVIKGNMVLVDAIAACCPGEPGFVRHPLDQDGNQQHWFVITNPPLLAQAAQALKAAGARLCMISGYSRKDRPDCGQWPFGAAYHFELEGVVYNVKVRLSAEQPEPPTITPWFFNADWHEREMQELVGIMVKDQPNPTRLFLKPDVDAGVLDGAVPLSVMMNGACTNDLWEHILGSKGGSR